MQTQYTAWHKTFHVFYCKPSISEAFFGLGVFWVFFLSWPTLYFFFAINYNLRTLQWWIYSQAWPQHTEKVFSWGAVCRLHPDRFALLPLLLTGRLRGERTVNTAKGAQRVSSSSMGFGGGGTFYLTVAFLYFQSNVRSCSDFKWLRNSCWSRRQLLIFKCQLCLITIKSRWKREPPHPVFCCLKANIFSPSLIWESLYCTGKIIKKFWTGIFLTLNRLSTVLLF